MATQLESHSASNPWEKPLLERLQMLQGNGLRVAYFSEAFDQGSFRYRCYNMAQALNNHSSAVVASYFVAEDLRAVGDLSEHADVLVLSRVRYDAHIHRLIESFQARDKRVLFDIDDLIFSPDHAPLVATTLNYALWGKDLDNWFALAARIGATLKLCDGIITTTDFLSDEIRRHVSLPIAVIPNFLNVEQIAASVSVTKRRATSGLTLGYFSGSTSHQRDFDVAVPGVIRFLSEQPEHRLMVVGYLELPASLEAFTSQIERRGFMSPTALQASIAEVDASIVPLQENPFTYSKSELKFFEAGLVKTPTIASPTPPYQAAITHLDNGVIAENNDWASALDQFLALTTAERIEMGERAQEFALARFTGPAVVESLMAFLGAKDVAAN